MTDVVKIAKECRETLAAEIAKLDDFLLMAEKLMKYNRSGSGKVLEADDEEATELTSPAIGRPHSEAAGANGAQAKS
jgi:hypothetical protein